MRAGLYRDPDSNKSDQSEPGKEASQKAGQSVQSKRMINPIAGNGVHDSQVIMEEDREREWQTNDKCDCENDEERADLFCLCRKRQRLIVVGKRARYRGYHYD